ncbi:MAG: DUF3667 domain-containing protein [Burkholderiales bacterium]|nr:DUF3667 domain-containing protein [Burkholderiales bacterium]
MAASCLNCNAPLPEPKPRYCGACGQETNVKPPKVGEFIQQFGGAYFSTEGALWRTLALLLFKPGELTRRYLAGRRKHYVLPLRLYLTISLLVLLVLRVASPAFNLKLGDESLTGLAGSNRPPNVILLGFGDGKGAGLRDGKFFCEGLPAWMCDRFRARLDLDPKGLQREIALWPERFMSRWGTAMFLLVPLFALFTQLTYFGRGLRYTEHLVYALHVHSFWFAALAITLLPMPGADFAYLAMPVYAFIAARRVYGGGWFGTVWRALVVAMLYGIVLGVALGIVALWAFFFS